MLRMWLNGWTNKPIQTKPDMSYIETLSSAHVYIGFKEYSSTAQSMDHSLTHPTEKLFLWYHFNRLRNSSCGRNSQCVFILIKSVTNNHFISHFQNFFERQNMKWTVLNWWKKNVSLKTYRPFCIEVSWTWLFH